MTVKEITSLKTPKEVTHEVCPDCGQTIGVSRPYTCLCQGGAWHDMLGATFWISHPDYKVMTSKVFKMGDIVKPLVIASGYQMNEDLPNPTVTGIEGAADNIYLVQWPSGDVCHFFNYELEKISQLEKNYEKLIDGLEILENILK